MPRFYPKRTGEITYGLDAILQLYLGALFYEIEKNRTTLLLRDDSERFKQAWIAALSNAYEHVQRAIQTYPDLYPDDQRPTKFEVLDVKPIWDGYYIKLELGTQSATAQVTIQLDGELKEVSSYDWIRV